MNIKSRQNRNEKIMRYLKTHTFFETATHFDLSVNQIFRIKKQMLGEGLSASSDPGDPMPDPKKMRSKKAWFRKDWGEVENG